MNWYAYVGNDPVNGVDPDGKAAWILFGAIAGASINAISQGLTKGWDNIDYSQVAVAGVAGGLAMMGAGMVATAATEMGMTGVASVTANVVGNGLNGGVIGAASVAANIITNSLQGDFDQLPSDNTDAKVSGSSDGAM